MAIDELAKIAVQIECSSIYCTKPMYVEDQDYFFNMVVVLKVLDNTEPHKLLERIHEIESLLAQVHPSLVSTHFSAPLELAIEWQAP